MTVCQSLRRILLRRSSAGRAPKSQVPHTVLISCSSPCDGYSLKTMTGRKTGPTIARVEGVPRVPPRNSRYPEIADQLRERIMRGEWAPGSTLPTLDELAAEYGADKNTISRAINEVLEPEGLVW